MTPSAPLARSAGLFYLLMLILGGFAHLGVRGDIHVPGDATATAQNLAADPTMFRLSLVADILMAIAFVAVGVLLFRLLRHVERHSAVALVVFVATGAGMILINLVWHHAALLIATDPVHAALRSDELMLLLLDLHAGGYTLAGIFFGLWLLPLAHLVHRSGLFPRLLGPGLLIAGISWIIDTVTVFLVPDLSELVRTWLRVPTIIEFWLIAYLLVKGIRSPAPGRDLATRRPLTSGGAA